MYVFVACVILCFVVSFLLVLFCCLLFFLFLIVSLFFFCSFSFRVLGQMQRLAASVLKCGKRKIWLDPNEANEISNANSRSYLLSTLNNKKERET